MSPTIDFFPLEKFDAFMAKQRIPRTMDGDDALMSKVYAAEGVGRVTMVRQDLVVIYHGQVLTYFTKRDKGGGPNWTWKRRKEETSSYFSCGK